MLKQYISSVCIVALLATGTTAWSQEVPANNQEQGSLSNQAFVSDGSQSNVTNNQETGAVHGDISGAGYNYEDTSDNSYNYDNKTTNTSTSIANQNGYVTSIPIIASSGTCLGSAGTNISAAGFGLGGSKTVVDEECNKRQQQQLDANIKAQEDLARQNKVKLLQSLGLQPAALSLLCQDPEIRLALKAGLEPVVYNKVCAMYEDGYIGVTTLPPLN